MSGAQNACGVCDKRQLAAWIGGLIVNVLPVVQDGLHAVTRLNSCWDRQVSWNSQLRAWVPPPENVVLRPPPLTRTSPVPGSVWSSIWSRAINVPTLGSDVPVSVICVVPL